MLEWLRFGREAMTWVWNRHYHVPRGVYAASVVAGGVIAQATETTDVRWGAFLLVAIGAQGLLRWTVESRPPPAVVVARFEGDPRRGIAVQNEVVTALRDHLRPEARFRVVSVPVVVGRPQRGLAARLRKRLSAVYLVYGDVRTLPDGESVYPRLVRPTYRYVEHWDWFTKDRTPQRTVWQEVIDKLTPLARSTTSNTPTALQAKRKP